MQLPSARQLHPAVTASTPSDTSSPSLTWLSIPDTVDVSHGTAEFSVSGTATDDLSGVKQIILYLDRSLTYSFQSAMTMFGTYNFLGNFGVYDSWSDGSSTELWGISPINANGVYNITSVSVQDAQGNSQNYTTAQLAAMGINTRLTVTGAVPDTTPPTLVSLSIPTSVDVSQGTADLTISGVAADAQSGVKQMVLYLDRGLSYSFQSGSPSFGTYTLLGNFGITDSWSDGLSTQTWGVSSTNMSGVYNITSVSVQDLQGNTQTYSAAQLLAMGVNTSINLTGATPDTTAPTLVSLSVPSMVDASQGTAELTITATVSDTQSGVQQMIVYLDKGLTYAYQLGGTSFGTYAFLGNFGVYDSWSDGTSTQSWGVSSANASGVYSITSVSVQDARGNIQNYTATQLAELGVNTHITLTGPPPDTTAPTATAFSPVDEAVAVPVSSDIVVTFSEEVAQGIGSIAIHTTAGLPVAIYDAVSSSNMAVSGNTLTLNPSADLDIFTSYRVDISPGAIKDLAGNAYAGVSDYNFTTQTVDGLYHFFVVAFAAAPGVEYMNQLAEAWNWGLSLKEIVNIFTTKPQFTDVYPESLTNAQLTTQLVDIIVKNSASDAAKAEARADINWCLDHGWTRGDVIYTVFGNLATKPLDHPTWGDTALQFLNQTAVARYFTEVMRQNTTDLATLRAVVAEVTPDTDVSTPELIATLIGVELSHLV